MLYIIHLCVYIWNDFMCILLYMIMYMLLSATSTHFKWELMLYRLHCPTLNTVLLLSCQMETFSELLALCEGNPPVTGGFPSQRPVTQNFDVIFDLRLNKRLSKPSIDAGD